MSEPETSDEPEPLDPAIEALLGFEPVPRQNKRKDGWTPALQRAFIAELARTGSPTLAAEALGKGRHGIEKVYKSEGAESFRAAWDEAVALAAERAADARLAAFAGSAGLRPPSADRRRKAEPFAVPGSGGGDSGGGSLGGGGFDGGGHDDDDGDADDEEFQIELIERIFGKFLRKVEAEREARLAGEIVSADFFLRQITCLEVMIDLIASGAGLDPWNELARLKRKGANVFQIVDTPFTMFLDLRRREYWESNGEPMRPLAFREEFLHDHGTHRSAIQQNAYGALTAPARGHSEEQWRAMTHQQQEAARQRQFDEDAAEQVAWEAQARREHESRRAAPRDHGRETG